MSGESERISEIINRLDAITLETSTLTQELKAIHRHNSRTAHTQAGAASVHNYREGDEVVITNKYRDEKGTRGIIIYTTKTQITIIDGEGRQHTRKHTNVSKTK
jgi:hypothetical protein